MHTYTRPVFRSVDAGKGAPRAPGQIFKMASNLRTAPAKLNPHKNKAVHVLTQTNKQTRFLASR